MTLSQLSTGYEAPSKNALRSRKWSPFWNSKSYHYLCRGAIGRINSPQEVTYQTATALSTREARHLICSHIVVATAVLPPCDIPTTPLVSIKICKVSTNSSGIISPHATITATTSRSMKMNKRTSTKFVACQAWWMSIRNTRLPIIWIRTMQCWWLIEWGQKKRTCWCNIRNTKSRVS